ncbi:MAG: hypothetical protein II876_05130 [Synergistaceae bacterium]|nr:hypothetical protein [Synergistaceae bacterium]
MTNTPIVLSVENTLLAFTFNDMEVRTAIIDGQFWFCFDDVCNALGIQDNTEALVIIGDDEKLIAEFDTGKPFEHLHLLMINKKGLLILITSYITEKTYSFELWIVDVVLPALKKLAENDLTTREQEKHDQALGWKEENIHAAKIWLDILEAEKDTFTDEARIAAANEIFRLVAGVI